MREPRAEWEWEGPPNNRHEWYQHSGALADCSHRECGLERQVAYLLKMLHGRNDRVRQLEGLLGVCQLFLCCLDVNEMVHPDSQGHAQLREAVGIAEDRPGAVPIPYTFPRS